MNIVYASDNNFVDVMCVSIMSFNDHNSDATIYILDCGIQEHNKKKILELCSGKNTVLFVNCKKKLDSVPFELNLDRGSVASYSRLFIGTVLPESVEKVIYLDSDTLVRASLEEMFEISTAPYVVGGVRDAFSLYNKKVFGVKKGELMINAGIMLIDLKKWRQEQIEERVFELIAKKNKVFQGDQGIINTVFHGQVKELPLKYDVMTYLYDFTYNEMMLYRHPDEYFAEDMVKEAIWKPVIVHFSTSFKSYRPWEEGNTSHPFYEEWLKYFSKLNSPFIKTTRRVVDIKNNVFLWLVGILHAYIRPGLYMIMTHK